MEISIIITLSIILLLEIIAMTTSILVSKK